MDYLKFGSEDVAFSAHGLEMAQIPSKKNDEFGICLDGLTHSLTACVSILVNILVYPGLELHYPLQIKPSREQLSSIDNNVHRNIIQGGKSVENRNYAFSVLKLDLRFETEYSNITPRELDSKSVSLILKIKINEAKKHIEKLLVRINDKTCKIMVTGDLNSGKSSFCNALMNNCILPVDQQPCTKVFCEIKPLDEKANFFYAIPLGKSFDKLEPTTFKRLPIEDLKNCVSMSQNYSKIILPASSVFGNRDIETILIDSPGLNASTIQTTAIFSKQEEIDVVVFVLSSENHFTLSGKELLSKIGNEKNEIFFVANKFDLIENKHKCKLEIQKQLKEISPLSSAKDNQLLHFLGRTNEDFGLVADSLKKFAQENRSRTKIHPAYTYAMNLINDIIMIANYNISYATRKKQEMNQILDTLKPEIMETTKIKMKAMSKVANIVEMNCCRISEQTRSILKTRLLDIDIHVAEQVPFPGYTKLIQYSRNVRSAVLQCYTKQIEICESFARQNTFSAINAIQSVGISIAKEFTMKPVKPEFLFSNRLCKYDLNLRMDVWDFVDLQLDKLGVFSMTLSSGLYLLSRYLPRLERVLPVLERFVKLSCGRFRKSMLSIAGLAAAAFVCYFLHSIPKALPKNFTQKLKKAVREGQLIQRETDRICRESRKYLRLPEEEIRCLLQRNIDFLIDEQEIRQLKLQSLEEHGKFFDKTRSLVLEEKEKLQLVTNC